MKKLILFLFVIGIGVGAFGGAKVGIAWKEGKVSGAVVKALDTCGIEYVLLGRVEADYIKNGALEGKDGAVSRGNAKKLKKIGWKKSNAAEIAKDIDAIIFTGGEDISPELYGHPEKLDNAGEEVNAVRDVSDFLLMRYCIDNDIPTLGICRGMQMMGVASGAQMLQDMNNYYKARGRDYNNLHRRKKGQKRTARHDVDIKENTLAFKTIGTTHWKNVFSAHHQAVVIDPKYADPCLIASGTTTDQDITTIEIIERSDKKFMLGIQSHPELATKATPDVSPEDFEICKRVFTALKNQLYNVR